MWSLPPGQCCSASPVSLGPRPAWWVSQARGRTRGTLLSGSGRKSVGSQVRALSHIPGVPLTQAGRGCAGEDMLLQLTELLASVCLRLCVCTCVCASVCVSVHMCVCVHTCSLRVCARVCVVVCAHLCLCVRLCMHVRVSDFGAFPPHHLECAEPGA